MRDLLIRSHFILTKKIFNFVNINQHYVLDALLDIMLLDISTVSIYSKNQTSIYEILIKY